MVALCFYKNQNKLDKSENMCYFRSAWQKKIRCVMVWPNNFRVIYKTISALAAGIFLFQQVVWAGGELSAIPAGSTENRSGYVQPQTLQSAQKASEGAVAFKQAAEDYGQNEPRAKSALARGESPAYEYDGLGRITKTTHSNGDFTITSYYGSTNNKYQEAFFKAGSVWQYSVEYCQGTSTIHNKWIADLNPSTYGDETYQQYDTFGRLIQRNFDDGTTIGISYYGSTNNKYQERFSALGIKKVITNYSDTYEPGEWISPPFWPSKLYLTPAIRYKGGFNQDGGHTIHYQTGLRVKIGPFKIIIPTSPWIELIDIRYPWYFPAVIMR